MVSHHGLLLTQKHEGEDHRGVMKEEKEEMMGISPNEDSGISSYTIKG